MKQLVLLFIPLFFTAQTHRFVYEMQFKTDSTADFRKADMALDVNPDEVKFYNLEYVKLDSLNKTRVGGKSMMWDDETPVVIHKKNSEINTNYILLDNLFIIETKDKLQWKLTQETKEKDGYHLQKATTKFGGRNWIAWFTKEIHLQEGPYKFRGLPGLVFQVEDDKDHYKFSLIKSYKLPKTYETNEFLESFAGMKPVKISQERYQKLLLETYNDPLHDFRERFSKNDNPENRFYFNSIEIKDISQFKELTEMKKKLIRQNNNPIEIDKAVNYPEK